MVLERSFPCRSFLCLFLFGLPCSFWSSRPSRTPEIIEAREDSDGLQYTETTKVRISEETVPAVGGWFLGHLGYIMPPDLLLTNLNLKLDDDVWRVQLAGARQPGTSPDPHSLAVEVFAEQLAAGPFQVQFSRDGAALKTGASAPKSDPAGARFFLEGVMR